ncbi:hypothetical protein G8O29_17930 [Rhodobacter sp. M37P]|uniref:Uncharacterized protein n=2 Tax=Rhodobacter calidifons TaxID=2715277 RepID=A0ABX0GCU5_9RHOB|nr:hypothetical protein [Rhodobacter calidifons]
MPSSAIFWWTDGMAGRRLALRLAAAALVRLSRSVHGLARLHLRLVLMFAGAGLVPNRRIRKALRLAGGLDRLSGRLALTALRLLRRSRDS